MKKTTKAKKSTSRTAKKATAAQKQNKLDSLNLSDGKLEVEKVRELEQLLGVDQVNAFKTNNLDVFQDNLSEMSLTDLQRLAAEAGVFPGGNKMALKNRLLKEFGSLKEIQKANINSISLVKGISKALAKDIKSKI